MTIYENTFSAGTPTQEITTGNSATSGTALAAIAPASWYYQTVDGAVKAVCTNPGSSGAPMRIQLTAVESVIHLRWRFKYTPLADYYPLQASYGTAVGGSTANTSFTIHCIGGKLRIQTTGSGTGTVRYTGATTMTAGSYYTIDVAATIGTSTTTGQIRAWLSDSTQTLVDDSTILTGIDLGGGSSAGFTNARGGIMNASPVTTLTVDDFKVLTASDASMTARDLFTVTTLTLSGVVTPSTHTVGEVQTLTLTATGGNANAKTYSAIWDGTSLGPQSSNIFTKTDTSAGTKNWSAQVSQSA